MTMGFLDRLDEKFAPSWKPQPGEIADGIITRISKREGTWGPYAVITIRVIRDEQLTDEELALHMQSNVLQQFVETEEPEIGDRIAVRYNGERHNPKGTKYYDYDKTLGKAATLDPALRLTVTAPFPTGGTPTTMTGDQAANKFPPAATPAGDDAPW